MPVDAVQRSVTVPLTPEQAFDLFTARIGDWWPGATHSVAANSGDVPSKIEIEPRPGGAITETTKDGATHLWGSVVTYDKGKRLVLDWHPAAEADQAGCVEVVFAVSDMGCRVELTHSGFEAMANPDKAALRADYAAGWQHILQDCLLPACAVRRTSVMV
ncbi:MAG: SRPBCC domain-containing protein [Pseudomonadota bacterium]